MLKPKRYFLCPDLPSVFLLVIFISMLTVIKTEVAASNINQKSFYGHQPLNLLVSGDKVLVSLLGGVGVEMRGGQSVYVVTDHTQSSRVAMSDDNTVSEQTNYAPFGDTKTKKNDLIRHYTNQTFEPETVTYNYHARAYDPTTTRFTSPDAIRRSISPYSYTENNPINFSDPNGLGRVSLYLYSMYGIDIPDTPNGVTSLKSGLDSIREVAQKRFTDQIIFARFEDTAPISVPNPSEDKITHLILSMHSNQDFVSVYDSSDQHLAKYPPRRFAQYLRDNLQKRHPKSLQTLASIFFDSCRTDCLGNQSNETFADLFTEQATHLFPNLEKVVATHYRMGSEATADSNSILIKLQDWSDDLTIGHISFTLDARRFLHGDFTDDLFLPPSPNTVHAVAKEPVPVDRKTEYLKSDEEKRNFFFRKNDDGDIVPISEFKEPAFRNIPAIRMETVNQGPSSLVL